MGISSPSVFSCDREFSSESCFIERHLNPQIEVVRRSSLSRRTLSIFILCTSVWWGSAVAPAQDLSVHLGAPIASARTTWWSPEGGQSNTRPHLLFALADAADTEARGSLRIAPAKASGPSTRNAICEHFSVAPSVNNPANCTSGPLLLSYLSKPMAGVPDLSDFRAGPAVEHETIQTSTYLVRTKSGGLFDSNALESGSFPYVYQRNYVPSQRGLIDTESLTNKAGGPLQPLLQIQFGGWRIPIMLYVPQVDVNSANPR
jgi:hypothetical protein